VSDAARRRCAVPPSARRDSSRSSPSACGLIDSYIERAVIEAPPADEVAITYQPEELTELNLVRAGVSTLIWATGYDLD
jgi:hypothetical protein